MVNEIGLLGIGTSTPAVKLHTFESTNANTFITVENPATGASSAGVLRAKSNTATVNFQAPGSARTIARFGQTLGGWAEFLQMDGNGLIAGTNSAKPPSSRELKDQIHDLSAAEATDALAGLQPVHFQYKTEPGADYLGFIAEDVPDAVATQDRKGLSSMDLVAVLTKVVQGQQRALDQLNRKVAWLEQANATAK
ncbi:MAG: tail fiber domain-containing protein [Candidatus Competibacter sp.]|nr:tail fiber domain-containing protein [Candidatus Competibacter sp.]